MYLNAHSIHGFVDTLNRAGIPLPDEAQAALDTLNAVRSWADTDPIADAEADPDPLTVDNAAARVQDLALKLGARDHMMTASRAFDHRAARAFVEAIRPHAPQLLEQARPLYDSGAEVLQRAGEILFVGCSRDDAIAAGHEGLTVWENMQWANDHLGMVRAARNELVMLAGGDITKEVSSYIAEADGSARLTQAHLLFNHQHDYIWHSLTAAGFRLHLNNFEEARQVEARALAYDTQTDVQRMAQRKAERQDPYTQQYFDQVLGAKA